MPLLPDEAWKVLLDIERITPCMPGAELTEIVDEKTYKGKVSVRLGPVALAFAGQVTFEDVNDEKYEVRATAQGKDSKGRGGANANIVFNLQSSGQGSTVLVATDLNLSGSIAQYGRASDMIQGVATALIGQFALNLQAQLGASSESAAEPITATGDRVVQETKPISGLSLILHGLWNAISQLFRRPTR